MFVSRSGCFVRMSPESRMLELELMGEVANFGSRVCVFVRIRIRGLLVAGSVHFVSSRIWMFCSQPDPSALFGARFGCFIRNRICVFCS